MHNPTAVPRIPASASGVSTQRSAPNRSCNPAVARKTPPSVPTSSPRTRTESSRSISTWSASLTASTRRSSGIAQDPPELLSLSEERGWRIGVRVVENEHRIRGRLSLGLGDASPHELERLGLHSFGVLVGEHAGALEVPLVPTHALVLTLLLHTF